MREQDKNEIVDRYTSRLRAVGAVPEALGWLKGRQKFRFHYLGQAEGFEPDDSVLDVGCAFGDLDPFLRERGWRGRYTGIDIVPDLVRAGLEKYPGLDLRVLDLQEETLDDAYDWVLSSGALTSETKEVDSLDHITTMLGAMFEVCKKGVSANFVSPYVDYKSDVNYHPPMGPFMDRISALTRRFVVRYDYMPYEFTLYLYKQDAINIEASIFSAHQSLFEELKT